MRRSIETIIETILGKTEETGDKAHADGSPLTESTQFALRESRWERWTYTQLSGSLN